jgi:hypothetical protein
VDKATPFFDEWMSRAAIGRDGGQDTHGAWQGSYQVTIRPTGRCALEVVQAGRQLNASARRHEGDGEIESRSQTAPNDIESENLD